MIVRLAGLLLAVGAFVTPSLASAEPVAIASVPIEMFGDTDVPLGFQITVHGSIHLFHNIPITEATVGRTLIATASTDSQFAAFATYATNGIANITHFDIGPLAGGGGSTGADSEGLLFRLPPPAAPRKRIGVR